MLRGRSLAFFLVLLPVACLPAACNKITTIETTPEGAQPAPEAEEEWPVFKFPQEGYSISLPLLWRTFDMNPATFATTYEDTFRQNPQLRDTLLYLRKNHVGSDVKLFAIDGGTMKTNFTTNLNVMHTRESRETTLDEVMKKNLKELETTSVVSKPITHSRIKMQAGEGERIHFKLSITLPNGRWARVDSTSFVYVSGRDQFTITLVTLPERYEQSEAIFNRIGQSFQTIAAEPKK